MIAVFIFLFTFQTSDEAARLYTAIFKEQRPDAQLRLILTFEKKFPAPAKVGLPTKSMLGEILSMGMDCYQSAKNGRKVIEYGEKALKMNPADIHALALVAREYAVSGTNTDRAADYAKRVLKLTAELKDKTPPSGYTSQGWQTHLNETAASAQSTLEYIRAMTLNLVRARPKRYD